MSQVIRSFVGIGLAHDTTAQVVRLQDACPVGKAVAEENLHLTLVFCGEQPADVLEDFDAQLAQITSPLSEIELAGVDVMGRGGDVIALKARPDPVLVTLHDAVASAARAVGITLEKRKFRPHVTLARCNRPPDAARLQGFLSNFGTYGPLTMAVTDFALYRSTLHKSGALYDRLAVYPLAGTP